MMKRILKTASLFFAAIFLACVVAAAIESVRPGTMPTKPITGSPFEQKLVHLVNSTK